jgi:hypothetical protein
VTSEKAELGRRLIEKGRMVGLNQKESKRLGKILDKEAKLFQILWTLFVVWNFQT